MIHQCYQHPTTILKSMPCSCKIFRGWRGCATMECAFLRPPKPQKKKNIMWEWGMLSHSLWRLQRSWKNILQNCFIWPTEALGKPWVSYRGLSTEWEHHLQVAHGKSLGVLGYGDNRTVPKDSQGVLGWEWHKMVFLNGSSGTRTKVKARASISDLASALPLSTAGHMA